MLKINSWDKSFKYDGRYLLKGAKKYSGTFFTKLKSGKELCLNYEKGLLKTASSPFNLKSYEYDSQNNLINVKLNNKDIFVKEIKHNIGLEYTRQETINGVIGRTFDGAGKLLRYAVSPKLIFGFIKYIGDISIDTRYFLNQAKYLGDGRIQLKYLHGDFILNNGVIDKTIVKNHKNGLVSVVSQDGKNYKGVCRNGRFGAEINYITDKNGNPVWTRINDVNNKWSYDKKVHYDDFGHKIREIFTENDGKWFTENTFDIKGNVVLERRLNSSGKTIQTTKYKYNESNLLVKESVYNQKGRLVEETINKYYPNNVLKRTQITYFDSLGKYKNLYEYNEDSKLIKFSEIYDDLKLETFYDGNDMPVKFVEKRENDKIKYIKEYINDDVDCLKTIVKDSDGIMKYRIEHSKKIKKDTLKNINIFKTPDDKLIGKEFIIHNNKTGQTNFIYTNQQGKRIKYNDLCKLLGDEV